MRVEICRKCRDWTEFVALINDGEIALLACCCSKFNIISDVAFNDERRDEIVNSMGRNGRKSYATYRGKAFYRIAEECVGNEYRRMLDDMGKKEAPRGCPWYTEHVIDEWNGGTE